MDLIYARQSVWRSVSFTKTVNTYIEKQKEEVFYLNYKEEKVEMKKQGLQNFVSVALMYYGVTCLVFYFDNL